MHTHLGRTAFASALALAFSACPRPHAPFKWVDDFQETQTRGADGSCVISPGDQILIRVWNQEAMTTRARVRSDGRITVPLLNDVVAAGQPPAELAALLQTRLKDFFNNPVVAVAVEEQRPLSVSVMGEVAHPGTFSLEPGAGVLQALAAAGGLNDLADRDMIYVLRSSGSGLERVRMTHEALVHLKGRAAHFKLQSGDVVVVE
jgi:polysaccharide export outer membrane protein